MFKNNKLCYIVSDPILFAELQQAMARALPLLTQEERSAMVQALTRRQSGGALPLP
jgi:hypothetical protein